ncbi:MAG: hypothetical protein ICV83_07945 [Cytophagales bacterium]|nr:hypothetical protein [Cytophagales bacterium]
MLFVALLTSCTKEPVMVTPVKPKFNPAAARLDVYPLNWETIDYMPTPAGVPSVLVPWASGASRQFSKEIANDYKRIEGWELLYNTFNTQRIEDNWYFILYNKYRGLVRMYYYVPSSANYISTANIVHKLATEGTYAPSSPILNFADQEIVDVNRNSRFASMVERWQVARATWYAYQYELAYDANVINQNYTNFSFLWGVRSTQITQAKLNGTIEGTLKGSIKQEGTDFTISNTINAAGNGQIIVNGKSDADNLLVSLGQAAVTKIKDAITGGVAGLVSNFFSGIFKKSTTDENVNLKVQATIGLQGTLTSDLLITSPAFAISGYNQTATPGFSPAYNQPLGVFYLSARPIVNQAITQEYYDSSCRTCYNTYYTYTIRPLQYIFNPAVTGIARITQQQVQIIARRRDGTGTETINGIRYYVGASLGSTNSSLTIVGVRVTLTVTPNDGSPVSTIVRTFLPTVTNI